jgi:radical SAM protein with 4Fe4S-binding SPASM domain
MPAMIPAIRDGLRFFVTLTPRKLWNYFLLRSSYLLSTAKGRPVHWGMPASISLEPTNRCNLRCPECPSGTRDLSRPRGNVSCSLFKHTVDQLSKHLMHVILYFQGEPYLHPDFFDLTSYACKRGIYTSTSTNAHFLDDENARKTVASGLHRLIISLDGTDQKAYADYRRGGDLQKVLSGIRNVVKWKKKLRSSRPYLILQFLVMKNNEHQIATAKKLAVELGADRLDLKTMQLSDYKNGHHRIPANRKYSRYEQDERGVWKLKGPMRNRCLRMWTAAVITWDGRVVPCCFDKDASHQLGSLTENRFVDIWKGETCKAFRRKVFTGRDKIDICRNCTG